MKVPISSSDKKSLTRRYLIWCYKTTKEELDKIDRKFTQLEVDDFMLDVLQASIPSENAKTKKEYLKKIDEFKVYIKNKEGRAKIDPVSKKIDLDADYLYLKNRLKAIEKSIEKFFGKKEVGIVKDLYEQEMTRRILEAREH